MGKSHVSWPIWFIPRPIPVPLVRGGLTPAPAEDNKLRDRKVDFVPNAIQTRRVEKVEDASPIAAPDKAATGNEEL
jgi:hypothetical protein